MLRRKKILIVWCVLILWIFNGCGMMKTNKGKSSGEEKSELKIAADSSNALLANAIVKDFNLNNKANIKVEVMPSEEAVKKLQDKKIDLIFGYEGINEKKIKKKPIAFDGFGIIVNKNNPISGLSLDAVRKIYTGEITSWKEAGGAEGKIQPYGYVANEDIQKQFEKQFMNVPVKQQISRDVILESSPTNIKEKVAASPNAVGVIPGTMADDTVKLITLNGVVLSPDTLKNELYPLKNKVYIYFSEDDKKLKKFMQYITSDEGKKTIKKYTSEAS